MNIVVLLVTLLVFVIIAIIVLIIVMYILKKKAEQCDSRQLYTKPLDETSGNSKKSQDATEFVTSVLMKLIKYLGLATNTPELNSFVVEASANAKMGDEIFSQWLVDKYENHVPQKGQESNMADAKDAIIYLTEILYTKPQWKKTCNIGSENQLTNEKVEEAFTKAVTTFSMIFGTYLGEIDKRKSDYSNDLLNFRAEVVENLDKAKFGNWAVNRFRKHSPTDQQAEDTESVRKIITQMAEILKVQLNWTDDATSNQLTKETSNQLREDMLKKLVGRFAMGFGAYLGEIDMNKGNKCNQDFQKFQAEVLENLNEEKFGNWVVNRFRNHRPTAQQADFREGVRELITQIAELLNFQINWTDVDNE